MVIGLVGLAAMAVPAFARSHGALSGHAPHGALSHSANPSHAAFGPQTAGGRAALQHLLPAEAGHGTRWRFLPTPRSVFSVLALYGAFGNAGVHAFRLPALLAALAALVPALLVEVALVRPLWKLLFRLHTPACSPLEQLILNEAEAVIPFRNGRGMVSTVRDARRVQLAAQLRRDQAALPVKVGDRLLIEDVDAANERVTVSLTQR